MKVTGRTHHSEGMTHCTLSTVIDRGKEGLLIILYFIAPKAINLVLIKIAVAVNIANMEVLEREKILNGKREIPRQSGREKRALILYPYE